VSAHGDGVQSAELIVLTVMGAVIDRAFHAGIGGAFAAAIGAILRHKKGLLMKRVLKDCRFDRFVGKIGNPLAFAADSLCRGAHFMQKEKIKVFALPNRRFSDNRRLATKI
jgi:hypothetical protein